MMRHVLVLLLAFGLGSSVGCDSSEPPAKPQEPRTPDTSAGAAAPTTRPAVETGGQTIALFNGRDLTGWTYELTDRNVSMEQVWSVQDGILKCTGKPAGYLRTTDDYRDYVLTLEWRWPPGTPDGANNGVLVHTSTPGALGIWPKSIEVQLAKGHAGDFWIIGTELDVENEAQRKDGRRHLNLTDDSEKPVGEWNEIEITCRGDEVIVKVNGDLVNHATNCSVTEGAICLQSEGAPIEYRNIRLTPLAARTAG